METRGDSGPAARHRPHAGFCSGRAQTLSACRSNVWWFMEAVKIQVPSRYIRWGPNFSSRLLRSRLWVHARCEDLCCTEWWEKKSKIKVNSKHFSEGLFLMHRAQIAPLENMLHLCNIFLSDTIMISGYKPSQLLWLNTSSQCCFSSSLTVSGEDSPRCNLPLGSQPPP